MPLRDGIFKCITSKLKNSWAVSHSVMIRAPPSWMIINQCAFRLLKASATWNGCDKKRCTRARLTVCLSSSLNSSIPRMAWWCLQFFCNAAESTSRAVHGWCDHHPQYQHRRIRDVESTDQPQRYPTQQSYGSIRLWHPSARTLLQERVQSSHR